VAVIRWIYTIALLGYRRASRRGEYGVAPAERKELSGDGALGLGAAAREESTGGRSGEGAWNSPPPYVPCWRRHSDSSLSPFHHGRLLTFGWGHERFVAGMPFSRKRDAMAAPFGLCCLCIRVTTFRRVLTRDEAELTRTRKGVG
jgi:hypothetical protein